jgi:hypothetical protein
MDINEFNRVSQERLQAKRDVDNAIGTDEYQDKVKRYRALDHQREAMVEQSRKERQAGTAE